MTINPAIPSSNKITIPPPTTALKRKDYPDVKYWLESEYRAAIAESGGDTDAISAKRRPGRPTREDGPTVRLYLEDEYGNPMSAERLTLAGDKFKSLANALLVAGMAPPSWKKQTQDAYNLMHREMKAEFIEFALCEGDWKAEMYFTIEYPRWSRHKPGIGDGVPETKKRKRTASVLRGLTKMEDLDVLSMVRSISRVQNLI